MDAIIRVKNSEYSRYEDLLIERDALKKQAGIIDIECFIFI